MSEGKCGAPVECSASGEGIETVAAIPFVLTSLAVKGAKAGYEFFKNERAAAKKNATNVWLSEISQKRLYSDLRSSPLSEPGAQPFYSRKVNRVKLENIFDHLKNMNTVHGYNSGLHVTDFSSVCTNGKAYIFSVPGTEKMVAFIKDRKGQYQAINKSSEKLLEKNVLDVINTFYLHDLHYRLVKEWGFGNPKIFQTPQSYKFVAADQDKNVMIVEINKKNGQVSFENIPVPLRDRVEAWLNQFGECRITRGGKARAGKSNKTDGRVPK